ncbi:hypothetical protein GWA97_03275 [Flavobacterium sp. LaA7.5]|nr:hypothetical protein [Flavobacterium salilacus subsp. altitudinum]
METENNNLHNLIFNKGFEKFQDTLSSKFESLGIDYLYSYGKNDDIAFLKVFLNFGNIPVNIEIFENGIMHFDYFRGGKRISEKFKNCTETDFHTMLDHAYLYLKEYNFDLYSNWYKNLEKL